jgi:hypothetical protein
MAASQVVLIASAPLEFMEIQSFILGYNAYISQWTPQIGETLLMKR